MYTFHNSRTHELYFNSIEVYLSSSQHVFDRNHDVIELKRAIVWLTQHNSFVEIYIENNIYNMTRKYSTMHSTNFAKLRSTNRFDILINEKTYDVETRNENFRYIRLFEKKDLRSSNSVIKKNILILKSWYFLFCISRIAIIINEILKNKRLFQKKHCSRTHNASSIWLFHIFEMIIIDRFEYIYRWKNDVYFRTTSNWSKTSKFDMTAIA